MPSGKHQMELNSPIEDVWLFVSDMNKWAPLIPGYVEHHMIHDRQSTWKLKGSVGIVHKTVHLQIDILEWNKPTKVAFELAGLNENIKGSGYFEAAALNRDNTKITSNLGITAKGRMAPMINTVLKTLIPKTTKKLTEEVAVEIGRLQGRSQSVSI